MIFLQVRYQLNFWYTNFIIVLSTYEPQIFHSVRTTIKFPTNWYFTSVLHFTFNLSIVNVNFKFSYTATFLHLKHFRSQKRQRLSLSSSSFVRRKNWRERYNIIERPRETARKLIAIRREDFPAAINPKGRELHEKSQEGQNRPLPYFLTFSPSRHPRDRTKDGLNKPETRSIVALSLTCSLLFDSLAFPLVSLRSYARMRVQTIYLYLCGPFSAQFDTTCCWSIVSYRVRMNRMFLKSWCSRDCWIIYVEKQARRGRGKERLVSSKTSFLRELNWEFYFVENILKFG